MKKDEIVSKVVSKISKHNHKNLLDLNIFWSAPVWGDEVEEFKRYSQKPLSEWKEIFKLSKDRGLIDLKTQIWSKLANTDSYSIVDLKEAEKLASKYGKDIKSIYKAIEKGHFLPAPIVLFNKRDSSYELVAGNTRLMVARALGETPKVLIISV